MGVLLCNAAEELHNEAKIISIIDLGTSYNKLSEAGEKAISVKDNVDQVTNILSERFEICFNMKKMKLAFRDAAVCDNINPTCYKGRYCMLRLNKAEGKHDLAFQYILELLVNFKNQYSTTIKKELLLDGFLTAPKVLDGLTRLSEHIPLIDDIPWNDVIQSLADNEAWKVLSIIISGSDSLEPTAPPSFKVQDVRLSGLLKTCEGFNWRQWGQNLAIELLKHGAKYTSIASKHLLHAAFIKGTKTDTYDLLKHILLHYVQTNRDRTDDNGHTLLHLACRMTFPSQETAVRLLLNNQLDPDKKNKDGQLPVDLLPDDSPCRQLLTTSATPHPRGQKSATSHPQAQKSAVSHPQAQKDSVETTGHTGKSTSNTGVVLSKKLSSKSDSEEPPQFEAQQWTKSAIQKWLTENNLKGKSYNCLQDMSGPQMAEMRIIQTSAPEVFYKILSDQMQLKFAEILHLSSIIRKLQ